MPVSWHSRFLVRSATAMFSTMVPSTARPVASVSLRHQPLEAPLDVAAAGASARGCRASWRPPRLPSYRAACAGFLRHEDQRRTQSAARQTPGESAARQAGRRSSSRATRRAPGPAAPGRTIPALGGRAPPRRSQRSWQHERRRSGLIERARHVLWPAAELRPDRRRDAGIAAEPAHDAGEQGYAGVGRTPAGRICGRRGASSA